MHTACTWWQVAADIACSVFERAQKEKEKRQPVEIFGVIESRAKIGKGVPLPGSAGNGVLIRKFGSKKANVRMSTWSDDTRGCCVQVSFSPPYSIILNKD